VITNALVHRVDFEGDKATGVTFSVKGRKVSAISNLEVILSSGAIGSPHILMLSGVGDKDELAEYGIKAKHNLPGVGKNLQDHLQIRTIYKVNRPITINDELKNPLRKVAMGMEYALFRTGPLTMAARSPFSPRPTKILIVQTSSITYSHSAPTNPQMERIHFQPLLHRSASYGLPVKATSNCAPLTRPIHSQFTQIIWQRKRTKKSQSKR